MNVPRTGLITVSLEGERLDLAEKFDRTARHQLARFGLEVLGDGIPKTHGREVLAAVESVRRDGAESIVYLMGTWVSAPDVVTAVQLAGMPTAVWGVPEGASFSSVGANVVHGALEELGLKHKLVYGLPDDEETLRELVCFLRAARVKHALNGALLGLIGGRSLGMYPSTTDPLQVKRVFGLEIEHVDQLLLVETARGLDEEKVTQAYEEFKGAYGQINVPMEIMSKSLRMYFALKQLVSERQFDFVALKCLEEVINTYVSCCLPIALANDEGLITACQSDINAAIAMQIMHLLTGSAPMFADVNVVDKDTGVARLVNCGTMPTVLATSKKDVEWNCQYEYMGKARGACPTFCCRAGHVTFAALSRIKGDYVMQIASGEAFEQPKSVLAEVRDVWPQAFVKLHGDPLDFYRNLRSNHMVAAYGDVTNELIDFCALSDIRPILT
ncbi:MAG: hypothetical protein QME79_07200 [Bacillota bacterium]|nr:hypothetical protein [Bacillota bacterium]